ncbi:MAG: 2-oxoglutarate and iron-dependent oxygenase domain-containing protein [Pseudomonadota bacterium]
MASSSPHPTANPAPHAHRQVPELSLRQFQAGSPAERTAFTGALFAGLKDYGFVILKDHAIDPALLTRAYDLVAKLFALPVEEKLRCDSGDGGQRGYTAFGREHAKDSDQPDLKEFWHVGREFADDHPLATVYPPNLWPERPAGFRETLLALFGGLEAAGHTMLEALAPALDLPPTFFSQMAADGNSILRLLHYPPIADDAPAGAVRAAAHEDINLITLLVSANGAGLELLDRDGTWLAVETDPENLIVDAGDMLARITNGVIPATTHRVVNPAGPNVSRYSMPFFMHPHPDAILDCLPSCLGDGAKAPPVTADEFLKQRLREIGLSQ